MTLEEMRDKVNRRLTELASVRVMMKNEKVCLAKVKEQKDAAQTALALAQEVAQRVQEDAHRRIAHVVSRSLEDVFEEPYRFRIIFEQKRGKTEARLVFERDGMEVDPMTASGGGVVDVAAFALRLSCLMLSRPPLRRLLVLDEPFKFVSADYRGRVRTLLETLSKELECQFVLVTHLDELKTGTVIEL